MGDLSLLVMDKESMTPKIRITPKRMQSSVRKILVVDTVGNVTYSLIVGSILDCFAGLNFAGIVTSRASATLINFAVGGIYGWWREKLFRFTQTNKESGKLRKIAVDLLACNTFQIPIYATGVILGSFVSEGHVNLGKVGNGVLYLAMISPFIGPTLGWYMDCCRKLFGVEPAIEGAYKSTISNRKH